MANDIITSAQDTLTGIIGASVIEGVHNVAHNSGNDIDLAIKAITQIIIAIGVLVSIYNNNFSNKSKNKNSQP